MSLKFYNTDGELIDIAQSGGIIDTVLDANSDNPVSNAAITKAITQLQGTVTGVKGDRESTYRTGNVNLTAEQVGGLSLSQAGSTRDYKIKEQTSSWTSYFFNSQNKYYVIKGYLEGDAVPKYLRICCGNASIGIYSTAILTFPINMVNTPVVLTTSSWSNINEATNGKGMSKIASLMPPYNVTPTNFQVYNQTNRVMEQATYLKWIKLISPFIQ